MTHVNSLEKYQTFHATYEGVTGENYAFYLFDAESGEFKSYYVTGNAGFVSVVDYRDAGLYGGETFADYAREALDANEFGPGDAEWEFWLLVLKCEKHDISYLDDALTASQG